MRVLIPVLSLLFFAAAAHAALPPEVQSLQTALTKAEEAHKQLDQHLQQQQKANKSALERQFRLTTLHLRLNQWPEELLLTQAVLSGSPTPVTNLTQSLHNQTRMELQKTTSRLASLTKLRAQAAVQLEQLTALQTEFANASGRLTKLEKSALSAARSDADILAAVLTQNLSATAHPTAIPAQLSNTARLPVAGRLEVAYNAPLPGGGHAEGLTFRTSPGATVTAVWAGSVLYAGPFRNLGGLVIIRSGNRHMVYGGFSTLAVTAGTEVQAQTPLGTLSDTPPARLYLEVRQRGHTIDPAPLLL